MSHRAEFIAALRAMPEDCHLHGALRLNGQGVEPDCFCALGVGTELFRRAHPDTQWDGACLVGPDGEYVESGLCETWLGLAPNEDQKIIDLNDAELRTFAQIADWLEAQP